MPDLGIAVGWASLGLGVLSALVGLVLAWRQKDAAIPAPTPGKLGEQGAVDDIINASATFAKALKDLDRGIQLVMLGVLFIAVAALAAGFNTVADAITSAAGS
jgi:hypothetical protein